MKKIIVFTDLDGTLLDSMTYSYEAALPALRMLSEKEILLIISSSKTRVEIEHYREKFGNDHPFVSENGGGIFIPKNYFDLREAASSYSVEEAGGYDVIRLGARYSDLRSAIRKLRQAGFEITGFGDMTDDEVAAVAFMPVDEASRAKAREFDEPFGFEGAGRDLPRLLKAINEMGLTFTQGQFFHILGNSDKGKAFGILKELYEKKYGDIITIALGDSPNDAPMLANADYPVIVQKPDGSYDSRINVPNLIKADGIGPEGWNRAVMILAAQLPEE